MAPTSCIACDATGREEPRRDALDALGKRGVLVCIGHGKGLSLTVSPDLIANERTVMGSEYFRYDELATNVDLLREHRDRITPIVTHRFAVTDLAEGFDLFMSGERANRSSRHDRPPSGRGDRCRLVGRATRQGHVGT